MLSSTTTQNICQFQDIFINNSTEEIDLSAILDRQSISCSKEFFFFIHINPLLKSDNYSSLIYESFEFKNETAFTEEFYKEIEKEKLFKRISKILNKLVAEEEFFKDIDTAKLLKNISEMIDSFSREQMKIPEDELYKRIRKILALEAVAGILNELTTEQMKAFEESIKR